MIEVCVTDLRLKIALVLVMPRVYDAHKQTHTHTLHAPMRGADSRCDAADVEFSNACAVCFGSCG